MMTETQPTDRQLLESAARAAGIIGTYFENENPIHCGIWDGFHYWNPLLNDAAALRLAVLLRVSIQQEADAWKMQASTNCGLYGVGVPEWAEEVHNGDPMGATRRAIVRAAASLATPEDQKERME